MYSDRKILDKQSRGNSLSIKEPHAIFYAKKDRKLFFCCSREIINDQKVPTSFPKKDYHISFSFFAPKPEKNKKKNHSLFV